MDFVKNVFPPLEPKLLVMWERIGEALQNCVVSAVHTVQCLAQLVVMLASVQHIMQLVKLYEARKIP